MNLFEKAEDRFERLSTARHRGYVEGRAEGYDVGRTEALNNVRDAVTNSSVRTRVSKSRLIEHIDRNA
jgi:hypothetical protein